MIHPLVTKNASSTASTCKSCTAEGVLRCTDTKKGTYPPIIASSLRLLNYPVLVRVVMTRPLRTAGNSALLFDRERFVLQNRQPRVSPPVCRVKTLGRVDARNMSLEEAVAFLVLSASGLRWTGEAANRRPYCFRVTSLMLLFGHAKGRSILRCVSCSGVTAEP